MTHSRTRLACELVNPTCSSLQRSKKVFTNAPSRQLMWVKIFQKKKRNDCFWRTSLPKGTWKDAPRAGDARAVGHGFRQRVKSLRNQCDTLADALCMIARESNSCELSGEQFNVHRRTFSCGKDNIFKGKTRLHLGTVLREDPWKYVPRAGDSRAVI